MNISIVAVDKLREPYARTGCALYLERLGRYYGVTVIETRKEAGTGAVLLEGRAILGRIDDDDIVWALDRSGIAMSSTDLARRIGDVERSGKRRLVIAIGGPEGLDESVLARADLRWSLSPLTFLHEMARLIALEQLYRAAKIGRGEPYHR
jgi:23S rRNA (pseudouridine1915-N3)-methyltransferase